MQRYRSQMLIILAPVFQFGILRTHTSDFTHTHIYVAIPVCAIETFEVLTLGACQRTKMLVKPLNKW